MIKSEKNGKFETCTGIISELSTAHLKKSETAVFVHLVQTRKMSYQQKASNQHWRQNIFPPKRANNPCVFSDIGLANSGTGKIYTGLTGSFPVTSNRGLQYMLILFSYDTNAILVETIKTRIDAHMLCTYDVLC